MAILETAFKERLECDVTGMEGTHSVKWESFTARLIGQNQLKLAQVFAWWVRKLNQNGNLLSYELSRVHQSLWIKILDSGSYVPKINLSWGARSAISIEFQSEFPFSFLFVPLVERLLQEALKASHRFILSPTILILNH